MQKTVWMLCTMFLLMSGTAYSSDKHQEHRSHDAHAHGLASLNIAQEGQSLVIELESPAANLVGFEHQPGTSEEEKKIQQAMLILNNPDQLFVTSESAQCQVTSAEVESELAESQEHHDDDHKEHGEDHHEEAHSDIEAYYEFSCLQPDKLNELRVLIMEKFPATENIRVQFIGEHGQQAANLNKAQNVFHLH